MSGNLKNAMPDFILAIFSGFEVRYYTTVQAFVTAVDNGYGMHPDGTAYEVRLFASSSTTAQDRGLQAFNATYTAMLASREHGDVDKKDARKCRQAAETHLERLLFDETFAGEPFVPPAVKITPVQYDPDWLAKMGAVPTAEELAQSRHELDRVLTALDSLDDGGKRP